MTNTKPTPQWEQEFAKQFCYRDDGGLELDWDVNIKPNGSNRVSELLRFIRSQISAAEEIGREWAYQEALELFDRLGNFDEVAHQLGYKVLIMKSGESIEPRPQKEPTK